MIVDCTQKYNLFLCYTYDYNNGDDDFFIISYCYILLSFWIIILENIIIITFYITISFIFYLVLHLDVADF